MARKRRIDPVALQGEPFVLFARSVSPDYHERILALCAAAGFHPEVRHEVRHWLSVVSLVSQGLGVALVPRLAQALATGGRGVCAFGEQVAGRGGRIHAYCIWRDTQANAARTAFVAAVRATAATSD